MGSEKVEEGSLSRTLALHGYTQEEHAMKREREANYTA